jgi:hypothetical protein
VQLDAVRLWLTAFADFALHIEASAPRRFV